MDVAKELDLLKKIKRHNPDIYVVFTSSKDDIETVTNSLKYGAFDYVVKKDHELEGIGKILASIYEIGEMLKYAQPSFIKKTSE
jgi:polysaccharide export outer membrane protein